MNKQGARIDDAWEPLLNELRRRREHALAGGGAHRIQREHEKGRLAVRERIARLVDPDSFLEFGMLATTPDVSGSEAPSTFLCGLAEINGQPVAIGAEDFTIQFGGHGVHLHRFKGGFGGFIEEFAYGYAIPLVLLLQGAGGSVELQDSKGYPTLLAGQATFPIFELLERVPVVSAILGPTAGGSAARAVATHFTVMTRDQGCLFAGGPPLVKQATGVDVDKLELGGVKVHVEGSGVVSNAVDTEDDAFDAITSFLWYLPPNVANTPARAQSCPPRLHPDTLLQTVVPNSRRAYNPQRMLDAIVDEDTFFEIAPDFGRSLRTGLARIDGYSVGILASDSRYLAGAQDSESSQKQVRLIELCDAFHVPIVYFVDVPGFMIGRDAERSGVLGHGSRAVQAIHRATVPIYTVQVRRSYGLAGQATGNANGKSLRLAWPTGEWGDMPVNSGIEAEFRAQIAAADDPEAERRRILERFAEQSSMWRAVERFAVEHVVDPRETRDVLARLLSLAARVPVTPKRGATIRI